MKRRLWGIPIGIIIAAALTGVAVAAILFTITIPSHIKVVPPFIPPEPEEDYTIGVYSNESCTTPVDEIEWGDVEQGQSKTKRVYIKNLGNQQVKVSMSSTLSSSIGAIEPSGSSWDKNLAPGDSRRYSLRLSILDKAPLEDANFTIDFHSEEG